MTAADARPADLAALRTELRVEVERVCYGAEWEEHYTPSPDLALDDSRFDGVTRRLVRPPDRRGVRWTTFFGRADGSAFRWIGLDPTSAIGAAMALVDGLQADGWPGTTYVKFAHAVHEIAAMHPDSADFSPFAWLECQCPPHLKAIVRTIAVLAARGAEWRRFLDLLTDASDAPPAP